MSRGSTAEVRWCSILIVSIEHEDTSAATAETGVKGRRQTGGDRGSSKLLAGEQRGDLPDPLAVVESLVRVTSFSANVVFADRQPSSFWGETP